MSELKEARNLFVGCSSSDNIPDKYLLDSMKYLEEVLLEGLRYRNTRDFGLYVEHSEDPAAIAELL